MVLKLYFMKFVFMHAALTKRVSNSFRTSPQNVKAICTQWHILMYRQEVIEK